MANKTCMFRINADTGNAFRACSELLAIDDREHLEEILDQYVQSVQKAITDHSVKNPVFAEKFPFVQ